MYACGFFKNLITYLPEQLDEIDLQGFHFKVLKADSRRLRSLEVTRK
jgi:Mg2+/Co2+ transporter CorC